MAWISCVGEKGGAETLMIECLRVLDRSRFRPEVIQLRPGPLETMLRDLDVTVHVLEMHRMREVHRVAGAILGIRRLVRDRHLRLLHSNGFRAHAYGGLAAALSGVAEVWTTHTVEQPGWSTSAILAIPTAQVLANCPRTQAYFEGRGKPTSLVWPGVNRSVLEAAAARTDRADLANRYRLDPGRRWVTVGARLQRFKGQDHFLRALARVLPNRPDLHGIVVGGSLFDLESAYQRELRELAQELGLEGRVTFTGFIPDADVAGLLAASTLVVHPALEEDFGLTVAEAQMLGIPVVAYATVGPAVILLPGETGWLVPVGDQSGLAATLDEALGSPQRLREFGACGRERVERLFGAASQARRTEEIYEAALGSVGSRSS